MSQHLRQAEESDIEAHVAAFNARCRSDSERVQLIKTASGLACSGQLRLHWDVWGCLALLESDGSKPLNGHYAYLGDLGDRALDGAATEEDKPDQELQEDQVAEDGEEAFAGVRLRRRRRRQKIPANWRRSVNGHAFRGPSSVLPDAGQSVQVLADIGDRVHQVIGHLFAKYMIRQPPEAYCIAVLTSDGWELTLSPLDCPLRVRLSLGPDESRSGKLLVREAGRPAPRGSILQLASLPTPMLHHLLDSLTQEEEAEIAATKACFRWAKAAMEKALRQRRDGSTVATLRREHASHL
ncbi:hypothetical protein BOX15_Mlig030634g2 [Macrostomum lignano]|uniref:Ras-associating domain-containing protein n=1 Tax=Macrostomum lignano TaxID=282301 RepID=A0A267H3B4_9PLAT|nr:hypothetical protein BOX15_Mlig030634g2 [Macrostomum lignano]